PPLSTLFPYTTLFRSRAFPLRFAGGHRQFWRRAGRVGSGNHSATREGKAIVCRCHRSTACVDDGFLARRRSGPAALFLVSVARGHRWEARFHAARHVANLPPSPLRRNGTQHSPDRLSALRIALRWENRQPHTQRLPRGPRRNWSSRRTLLRLVSGRFVQRISEATTSVALVLCRSFAALRPGGFRRLSRSLPGRSHLTYPTARSSVLSYGLLGIYC